MYKTHTTCNHRCSQQPLTSLLYFACCVLAAWKDSCEIDCIFVAYNFWSNNSCFGKGVKDSKLTISLQHTLHSINYQSVFDRSRLNRAKTNEKDEWICSLILVEHFNGNLKFNFHVTAITRHFSCPENFQISRLVNISIHCSHCDTPIGF